LRRIPTARARSFDPRTFSVGKGELETLFASVCFAFQIRALDQPRSVSVSQ
jgi:hypothetical protein